MSDPALHNDANKPETTGWKPSNEFERTNEAAIRERLKGGFLLPSQAVEAVRQQLAQDGAQRPDGQSTTGSLGGPFKASDEFHVKHADAIRERMRGGLSQAQAAQAVRDQLHEDARAGKKS